MYVCHWREALQQEAFQLSQRKKFTYRSYRWASPSLVGQVAKDEQAIDLPEVSVPRAVHSASGMGKRSRTRAVHSSAGDECIRPLNNGLGSNRSLSTYVESDRKFLCHCLLSYHLPQRLMLCLFGMMCDQWTNDSARSESLSDCPSSTK